MKLPRLQFEVIGKLGMVVKAYVPIEPGPDLEPDSSDGLMDFSQGSQSGLLLLLEDI